MENNSKNVNDDEKELLLQCQRGTEQAYRKLYEVYAGKIYTFCARMLGDTQEAEDVLQDTFVQVFRHAADFRFECSPSTWIFSIARNLCLDHLRRRKKFLFFSYEQKVEAGESFPDMQGAENTLEAVELKGDVQEALQKLSEKDRLVLVYREILGFSYEEIGEMMGWKEGTVKSRLHHARRLFARYFKEVQRYAHL